MSMHSLVLVHGMAAGLCLAGAPDGKETAARVAALVERLGGKSYADREEASRALDALGATALEALRKARQSASPEVRRRAHALVRKIEQRLETARLLAPTRLRLVYRDTPVREALADLAKRTGLEVRLDGDPARVAGRKVTLDTGEVPFWDAFALFCRQAGLGEVEPSSVNPPGFRGGIEYSILLRGGAGEPVQKDVMHPPASEKPVPLVLTDRPPRTLPTHLAGSVRFRALPPGTPLGVEQKAGEILLALEGAVEPALRWREVIAVRLDKILDDQGQARRGGFAAARTAGTAPLRGTLVVNGNVLDAPDDSPRVDPRRIPLRIEAAGKLAGRLKELRGTVTALVQSAPEDLVTVPDVLKAAGKRFHGPSGSTVHVAAVARQADGLVRLRVEVEAPPRTFGDGPAVQQANQIVFINGRRVGEKEEVLSALNFVLLDARGEPVPVAAAVNTGKHSGPVQEYELTYGPAAGRTPARFIFRDRRSAVIDIPFTLKDVPIRER
jgi:hypothetical protein